MITLQEAYEIAKKVKPEIDNVQEWEKAWVFGCMKDNDYEMGTRYPVVVYKEGGEAVPIQESIGMKGDKIGDVNMLTIKR